MSPSSRRSTHATFAAALAVGLLSVSCGSGVGNAAPRVGLVPSQTTAGGGSTFSLSLGAFVSDPDGDPLSFTVLSGGGAFAGDTYSRVFDTLGTYTVTFRVMDVEGKTGTGSFDVTVTTANLAVVGEGDDLRLLDTDTGSFLTVAAATGFADTFAGSLSTGHVVYERTNGTQRLFVFDPSTRTTHTLGDSPLFDTLYVAQTADQRVVFTRAATATPSDTDLFLWSADTGSIVAISAAAGVADGNPFVTSAAAGNLIYYDTGSPVDVYYYDPATRASTPVATGGTAETMSAVLPNDAAVFSRVGGGGELDLFYYTPSGGEVEIGADLGATILGQTKTYRGATSQSQVLFEVTGATDIDLYLWDPGTGASTAVAANPVDDRFVAVTPLDEVVFRTSVSGTDDNLGLYTHPGTVRAISIHAANDVFEACLSNGDVVYRREAGPDELRIYDTSASSGALLAGGGASFDAALAGSDKVVYTTAAGVFVVNTSGAPVPVAVGGAGAVFGGQTSGGDFVVEDLVSAQLDLVLWDESAGTTVTISSVAGDDTFGAGLANGDILFQRVVAPKTTSDLFLWDPATLTETRLTDGTGDHSVAAAFTAANG